MEEHRELFVSTYEAMTLEQKRNYAKLLNYPDAINPYDL